MKPRRTVLLYCSSMDERSILKLLLELHPYRVIGGFSCLPPVPDVAIVVDDRSLGTAHVAKAIGDMNPGMPLLVIPYSGYSVLPSGYPAHAELLPDKWRPAELLERLRVIARRKRGPKRHAVLVAVSA